MILIPMAGLSSRFRNQGYSQPKYKLKLGEKTVFYYSLKSFEKYFEDEFFIFVALESDDSGEFIKKECDDLGIKNYELRELKSPTKGQADTVKQAILDCSYSEPLLIFNIDTFRPGFTYPSKDFLYNASGYLETFIGSGANWSNVVPSNFANRTVAKTAEKQSISEYCCTGLYYFNSVGTYLSVFEQFFSNTEYASTEYYIAPMYNALIDCKKVVKYTVIDSSDVIFCGVPEEYEALKLLGDSLSNKYYAGGTSNEPL